MSGRPQPRQAWTRRKWLGQALALAGATAVRGAVGDEAGDVPFADDHDFVAEAQPANPRIRNLDLRRLSDRLTPNEEFFVFHQSSAPVVELETWRLVVGGLVDRPRTFSMTQLLAGDLPSIEQEVTIECAGNMPWKTTMNGQVGNALWSGISLPALLRQCGIRAEAREVVFFGADGARDAAGATRGPHARSMFVQDAMEPDALLATKMNGAPLSREHGQPLRLILPGWYGMAQIKWLTRIEVLDRRYEGLHMSRNYHTLHAVSRPGDEPLFLATSISRMRIKSVVARVARLRAAASYRVHGAAWGGASPIERVEVRVDAGPWRGARIAERGGPHAWLLWSYDWTGAAAGEHVLTSRAIDAAGNIQPTLAQWEKEIRTARENNAQWERRIVLPG